MSKKGGKANNIKLDVVHSSFERNLVFDADSLSENITQDGNKKYLFFNYVFRHADDHSRFLEIGIYNLLDKQIPGKLVLSYKVDGQYQIWDIDNMQGVDILHPSIADLGKFFEAFNKNVFESQQNPEVRDSNSEEQLDIQFGENPINYDDFFRKTRVQYENLWMEYLNMPNIAFKLNHSIPLPKQQGQGKEEVGKAYMQQNSVDFRKFKFSGLKLDHFEFNHSNFEEGLFHDCSLHGASFTQAIFKKVDFSGSEFALIEHSSPQPFAQARFDQINLESVSFSGVQYDDKITYLDLANVGVLADEETTPKKRINVLYLRGSEFKWVNFGQLLFVPLGSSEDIGQVLNMVRVKIEQCKIEHNDFFKNADLRGAQIIKTTIRPEMSFSGATFDKKTKFVDSLSTFEQLEQKENFITAFKGAKNVKMINFEGSGCSRCQQWVNDL